MNENITLQDRRTVLKGAEKPKAMRLPAKNAFLQSINLLYSINSEASQNKRHLYVMKYPHPINTNLYPLRRKQKECVV